MNIQRIIHQMTLKEKASLCVGGSYWHTKAIPRLNVPNIMMIDGPSGINKLEIHNDHTCPEVKSKKSTMYPCASCSCCSFDRSIIYKMGESIGEQMIKEGISLLLAPGVNIKRSPLCGRNFEYFSEDPFLTTTIAGSFIKGIQSKGIGATIKHFAANNQEKMRFFYTSNIDERTLREIYLASFEGAIKEAKPWAVMSSYNKINNVYSSINSFLLTQVLRDEWGYDGMVVSDWGGTYDRVLGVKAGLDLAMPGPEKENSSADSIVESVNEKKLDEKLVDRCVENVLKTVFKAHELIQKSKNDPSIQFGVGCKNVPGLLNRYHEVAREVAENSIVLLKNEDSLLPLPKTSSKPLKILYVGEFAKEPHNQGAGSARVKPFLVSNCYDESLSIVKDTQISIDYSIGYDTESAESSKEMKTKAIEASKSADIVVIFAGSHELKEIEGRDLKDIKLSKDINKVISKIAEINKNVVVVLQNGSPLEMPWIDSVKSVVETYLAGEASGEATANVLFGLVNPSGHLAESFPLRINDNPSFENFGKDEIDYKEGIFVGYRHYDKNNLEVLFPFGHGLSYTEFEYQNIRIGEKNGEFDLSVIVDVKNIGKVVGKTVAQLYVSDLNGEIERPIKELKGFEKVELAPGESKSVTFILNKRSFAWWKIEIHDWFVSKGKYQIIVGQSSRDPKSLVLDIDI